MSEDYINFKSWYVDILSSLFDTREAGLVVFMISLPLAERYFRLKANLSPNDDLNDQFMKHLCTLFPNLKDIPTARQFWNVYRNGFLHQATLSQKTRGGTALPSGSLTHDIQEPVQLEADGSFRVHPVKFSQQIIKEIEDNFTIFAGSGTLAPSLPTTVVYVGARNGLEVPPTIISTKGG